MWSIGKLTFDRQGVGSIIGAVFLVLILLTGYTFYTLHIKVTNEYSDTLRDMQQLDLKRNNENIEFISVSFTSQNKLNITVKNNGSYQAHLIWLGIFDETANTKDYYKINFYVNPSETVIDIKNETIPSFEGQERVIQLVTELGNTFSYSYPPSQEDGYDYVDKNTSDVDGSDDKGTHSLFSAQKYGPDGICDTLTELNTASGTTNTTLIDQESFENDWPPSSPSPWSENGRWNKESDRAYEGTYSADFDGGSGKSGNLTTCDLDSSDAVAIYVDFWYRDDGCEENEFLLYYYDGANWDIIADLGSTTTEGQWLHYQEKVTDSQYFKSNFKILWSANTNHNSDDIYVDLVTVKREVNDTNYELDLEIQWTDVDFSEANEWLCIYGGTMASEDIFVDVWNGTAWINLLTDLESGWNNVDVSLYLTSSTFTIRFRTSGDATQDTWEIDAAFLHVWTDAS